MSDTVISEQRARDAIAFDPLPASDYISVTESAIIITVNYSEALSTLLRSLPGAKWRAERRCWVYPFSSCPSIRTAILEINRLASAAKQRADLETERREKERDQRRILAEENSAKRAARAQLDREREMLRNPPRPFQREYLLPVAGAPIYHLSIEAIGDDVSRQFGQFGFRGWSGWVAQLFGSCPQKKFQRAFLKESRDYARANSIGSRGVTINYLLEQGPIYEVYARTSWRASERYFLRIIDGQPIRMTEAEVRECLEK